MAFRVLRTEDELGEALQRAALRERLVAEAYRVRADRYEAMLRPKIAAQRQTQESEAHPPSASTRQCGPAPPGRFASGIATLA